MPAPETTESVIPLLPCTSLDETLDFYRALGFEVTATPSGFVLRGRPQLVYLGTVQRSPDAWSEARGD